MIKWEDRPGANDAVSKLVEDCTIRHKFEDCIDIPPNHEYSLEYNLTDTQIRKYLQMEKAQIAQIKGELVTAVNAAVVATKLLQIASGAVYDEDGKYHVVDRERYTTVIDVADHQPGENHRGSSVPGRVTDVVLAGAVVRSGDDKVIRRPIEHSNCLQVTDV